MRTFQIGRNFLAWLMLAGLAIATIDAQAICNPTQTIDLYVGDTGSDAQCNYATIQDAIDAVQCPETRIILTGEATYNDEHLTVNNHTFTLTGGGAGRCGDTPPICDPTIGCGGGGAPALTTIGGHNGDSASTSRARPTYFCTTSRSPAAMPARVAAEVGSFSKGLATSISTT